MTAENSRPWTLEQVNLLKELVRERIAGRVIALKLKRSEADIRGKAAELGLLVPVGD